MEFTEYTGKTVEDAITEACKALTITSDKLDYEVVDNGSSGFLGLGSRDAVIKARVKGDDTETKTASDEGASIPLSENVKTSSDKADAALNKKTSEKKEEKPECGVDDGAVRVEKPNAEPAADPEEFLKNVFKAMDMDVNIKASYEGNEIDIELSGSDMGVLIGKRGQTLDSLQYLTSLVVNRGTNEYIRVKVDTEDYRRRRRETLENLAKNLAYKVKRTKKPVSLEPMNPYERRVIHSTLQNDKYVNTHSEGDEPYRRVVITLSK